VINCRCKSD